MSGENSIPAEQPAADPVQPEVVQKEDGEHQGATQAAQPGSEAGEKPQRPSTPGWVQPRIDELTRARREAERRAEQLEAMLRERGVEGGTPSTPATGQSSTTSSEEEIERKIQARIQEQRFNERCNTVYQEAVKVDPEFAEAYRGMAKAIGTPSTDFLQQVVEQPDAPSILSYLAHDYDEAARILSLPPLAQGRELERLSAKLSQTPRPPTVSGAPAPTRPIDTGSADTRVAKSFEEMDMDEFMRERNKMRRPRR